jgi:predicted transport protein
MGDINLFSINGQVTQLSPGAFHLERDLQVLVEKNMSAFFGVTFLQSEFSIPNGRIDSLGIDENYCPVIFEYKRSQNENVINQGLFYLDWLMDHKAEFKLLAIEKLGMETAKKVDWSMPCVICIASDFTKFDEHAVNQMQKNIKLIKYKKFSDTLILFEQINAPDVKPIMESVSDVQQAKKATDKTFSEQLAGTGEELREIYYAIRDYILSLGDDITENQLKLYCAYKKIKNIVCVEIRQKSILLYLRLDPDAFPEEQKRGILRDVRNVGHWGTGDSEVAIKSAKDFELIKYLLDKCYNAN